MRLCLAFDGLSGWHVQAEKKTGDAEPESEPEPDIDIEPEPEPEPEPKAEPVCAMWDPLLSWFATSIVSAIVPTVYDGHWFVHCSKVPFKEDMETQTPEEWCVSQGNLL